MIKFPVYDRDSGQNVFDWIMTKSEEVRQERKFWREMEYRILIAKREADGKLSQEKSQDAGEKQAPAKASAGRKASSAKTSA